MNDKHWKVGELARVTGLTVRTLHHWDELGLLVPSERTGAGYRVYDAEDVRRLYQVVALRGVGLSLEEIGVALDEESELRPLVERQLEAVDAGIELQRRLRERLLRVLEAPTPAELIETIEVVTMIEKHYTQEQLETLTDRAKELGPERMERAQREWAELYADVERERAAGTDPRDPRIRELAARAEALIKQFTGGDPGVRASLERMYAEEGPERASRGLVDREVFDYLKRARSGRED